MERRLEKARAISRCKSDSRSVSSSSFAPAALCSQWQDHRVGTLWYVSVYFIGVQKTFFPCPIYEMNRCPISERITFTICKDVYIMPGVIHRDCSHKFIFFINKKPGLLSKSKSSRENVSSEAYIELRRVPLPCEHCACWERRLRAAVPVVVGGLTTRESWVEWMTARQP